MNPAASQPRRVAMTRGFTLVELTVAVALGAVVFGAALAGVISLQKSYASTEQYAADLTDQTRLLDALSMDLRRAKDVIVTGDGKGNATAVEVTLPNYYQYDAKTGKAAPYTPSIYANPEPRTARYGDPAASTPVTSSPLTLLPTTSPLPPKPPKVFYRLAKPTTARYGPVTREEVRADADETGKAPACQPIADRVVRFGVNFDNANGGDTGFTGAIQARLAATFQPIFQTPAVPDPASAAAPVLTLHGMVFLRNNDLR